MTVIPLAHRPQIGRVGLNSYTLSWEGLVICSSRTRSPLTALAKRMMSFLRRLQTIDAVAGTGIGDAWTSYFAAATTNGNGFTPTMNNAS